MKTLKNVLCDAYQRYPFLLKRDVQEIVAFSMGVTKDSFFLSVDYVVEHAFLIAIEGLLKERASGRPLAYLLGYVDFYGCKIIVDSSVLIPRVETEVLLDKVFREIRGRRVETVFDICCGSGCLGIAFKKQREDCKVYLSDLSKEALNTAKKKCRGESSRGSVFRGRFVRTF